MSTQPEHSEGTEFKRLYQGRMIGILRWHELDAFWSRLKAQRDRNWFIYAIGESPPTAPSDAETFLRFINEIDALLRKEHAYDYCGIVYADDLQSPQLIKIFDPNHLGSSCGSSGNPTPPGWVLARIQPIDLADAMPLAKNRHRWWRHLFGG